MLDDTLEGQTGLVSYAGDAFVVSPLTNDTNTISNMLPALRPDIIPVQGSRPDLGLWIDADWVTGDQYQQIVEKIQQRERLKIILSSETLANFTDMDLLTKLIELDITPIFSLDKKAGKLFAQPGNLAGATSLELIQHAFTKGAKELILLDLESVGTMAGCNHAENELGLLIQEIKQELPEIKIISGGGVRHAPDIQTLLELGCEHVLVASAIHQCKLTPDDVAGLTREPAGRPPQVHTP